MRPAPSLGPLPVLFAARCPPRADQGATQVKLVALLTSPLPL